MKNLHKFDKINAREVQQMTTCALYTNFKTTMNAKPCCILAPFFSLATLIAYNVFVYLQVAKACAINYIYSKCVAANLSVA